LKVITWCLGDNNNKLFVYSLQEYSQHVANSSDVCESLVSQAADMSEVGRHGHIPSHDEADEPACSMEDVIQLLQLLSAVASDIQSTGLCFISSIIVIVMLTVS